MGQSRSPWSAVEVICLIQPFHLPKKDEAVCLFLVLPPSANKSPPFCTGPLSSFLAARLINCWIKPIRSSNWLSWMLFFNRFGGSSGILSKSWWYLGTTKNTGMVPCELSFSPFLKAIRKFLQGVSSALFVLCSWSNWLSSLQFPCCLEPQSSLHFSFLGSTRFSPFPSPSSRLGITGGAYRPFSWPVSSNGSWLLLC